MSSAKFNSYGSSGTGYGTTTSGNPSPSEIYLYDIIDDVRSWINKNKRNNITGRKIKPVMQNWLKELDKVYPHLSDTNVSNGKLLASIITDVKAAIQKVLAKSDSELTFEYLAQYGSPDKSRQVFWSKFNSLFETLADKTNVVKKGSAYNRKGGTGPGVIGGSRPQEEKQNRWYGGSSILRGAGDNHEKEDLQSNQTSGPSSPLNSPKPNTSPSSTISPSTPSSHIPNPDDEEDAKDEQSTPVGDSMTISQINDVDNRDYQEAFARICSEASTYFFKVLEETKVAYTSFLPGVKNDLGVALTGLRSVKQLLKNVDRVMKPMDDQEIEGQVAIIEGRVYDKDGKINQQELTKVITNLGFVPPSAKFEVFEVNLNSNNPINPAAPNRNYNQQQQQRRQGGGGGGSRELDKGSGDYKALVDALEQIRLAIRKRAKNYSELVGHNGNPLGLIRQASTEAKAIIENILSNGKALDIITSYSMNSSNFKGSLTKASSRCDEIAVEEDANELDKLVTGTTDIISNVFSSIANPDSVKSQYLALEDIATKSHSYLALVKDMRVDITAGAIVEHVKLNGLKSDSKIKNIIQAYQDLTNDKGPRVKSILPTPIRRIVSREMIKMLHEMESYWD